MGQAASIYEIIIKNSDKIYLLKIVCWILYKELCYVIKWFSQDSHFDLRMIPFCVYLVACATPVLEVYVWLALKKQQS